MRTFVQHRPKIGKWLLSIPLCIIPLIVVPLHAKTHHLYYGKKNETHQGFVQSLIVLMVGELNTLSIWAKSNHLEKRAYHVKITEESLSNAGRKNCHVSRKYWYGKYRKYMFTNQEKQDIRVLFVMLKELKRSRKSPVLCASLASSSSSSGISFLLKAATFWSFFRASSFLFFTRSQRGDSGINLKWNITLRGLSTDWHYSGK